MYKVAWDRLKVIFFHSFLFQHNILQNLFIRYNKISVNAHAQTHTQSLLINLLVNSIYWVAAWVKYYRENAA